MAPKSAADVSPTARRGLKAYQLTRTGSSNVAFRELVAELEKDLASPDGNEHAFFAQLKTASGGVLRLVAGIASFLRSQTVTSRS